MVQRLTAGKYLQVTKAGTGPLTHGDKKGDNDEAFVLQGLARNDS